MQSIGHARFIYLTMVAQAFGSESEQIQGAMRVVSEFSWGDINWAEVREWLTLFLAVVGGIIAIIKYNASQRQKRLENSFQIVKLFWESLQERDLERWRELFRASSEVVGASEGHFLQVCDGETCEVPFSSLFSEGPPDDGAIERMAELFDLVGYESQMKAVDLRIVYFQLGQLMDTVHRWVSAVEGQCTYKAFIEEHFPRFHDLYRRQRIHLRNWPSRTYAHIE